MAEIYMLVGVPGSGKTFASKQEFGNDYVWLNRDTEGGRTVGLVPKMEAALSEGAKRVVLDCTFLKPEDRMPFLAAAARLDVPLHCWFFDTPPEDAQFNICWRMCERYGHVMRTPEDYEAVKKDSNMFPPMVLYAMYKKLKEEGKPTMSEGFASMKIVKPTPWTLPARFRSSAVILDYDGTVRRTKSGAKYPTTPDDIEVFPEAAKKLQELEAQGVRLMGASNQSGVAKGNPSMEMAYDCFEETNRLLGVNIDYDFDYSRAGPISSWHRKPMPGMGVEAIWRHELDPSKVTFVGDMTSDKTFARRCRFNFEWAKDFFGLTHE